MNNNRICGVRVDLCDGNPRCGLVEAVEDPDGGGALEKGEHGGCEGVVLDTRSRGHSSAPKVSTPQATAWH